MQRSKMTPWGRCGIAAVAVSAVLSNLGMSAEGFDPLTKRLDPPSDMREQGLQKLMGTIKRTEKISSTDRDQQDLIVQLKTQEHENNITVNLGSVEQLKDMDVHVGNRIIVWGRLIIDGDNHSFVAHRLWIAGGTVDIERAETSSR